MRVSGKGAVSFLIAMTVAVSVLAGCGRKEEQTAVQATRVETRAASRGTLEITGTYIGTVAPHNSVDVTPLVSGIVQKVNVKVGDKVKEGDVLCKFDSKAAELQLKSAESAVDSAKAGKEAAKDQIHSAKKQADASITSMEGQVDTLRAQKKSSKKQLEELSANLDALKEAQELAAEAYEAAKKIYDSANGLYIQYQAFLSANPDCQTTAGLTAASIPQVKAPVVEAPSDGSTGAAAVKQPEVDQAAEFKQKMAAELIKELGKIPLTVEYLTEAGLNTLKDQMQQAQTASETATSGYTQAAASAGQLKAGIEQIDAQINALEDNIDAAEDAKNAAGGTKAYDAQIRAAETGVESAQYQVDLYTVTAPIDGIVEAVNVSENEISAQGYPAFTISDKEAMEVTFYVPEEVREFLTMGQEIHVETKDGEVKGHISSIGTAVDAQKGLFRIDAEITTVTDKSLLSNTSVSLSLVTNSVRNEILIPFDAVYYDNDQAYVFVVEKNQEESRAKRRDVTTGAYNNEQIAVLEGISEGDEVITTWGAGLKDGAMIEILGAQD